MRKIAFISAFCLVLFSCTKDNDNKYEAIAFPEIKAAFGDNINSEELDNYANQFIPPYITKDNAVNNPVTDKGATLGRVLFYDKNLSVNNTISCASCHRQQHAFSDDAIASAGVAGTTGRHAMRLINTRFANETHFFWDERAVSLEEQTTMPVKDHGEMGFSGENGNPVFDDLIIKLSDIGYYKELFKMVYGSEEITEEKIQLALSQFVHSIQSFDSKYDEGRAVAANDAQPFTNFTPQENMGKNLFLTPPAFDGTGNRTGGGFGCAGCHQAPEFDIDPNSLNNGVTQSINNNVADLNNTRAPSLRDLARADGTENGPFMHTGTFLLLTSAINHYNVISKGSNRNLDPKLSPTGNGVNMHMTTQELAAINAFLKTLGGTNVYTDPKWSNPFLAD